MNAANKPVKITLAHINDTHSYFEPQSLQLSMQIESQTIQPFVSNGGFARIASRAKQLKQSATEQGREFIFLHAGDCFQGTLYFSLFKGEANARLLNALEPDAMALGNHELDMGNQPVAEFLNRIRFPLLAGNWDLSNENPHKPLPIKGHDKLYALDSSGCARYLIKQVNDERIAIFGVSLDLMAEISNPDPDTSFAEVYSVVKSTVEHIRSQGINKIILLSHLGFEADVELAGKVDGIAVIVGGHSHTLMGDFSDLGLAKECDYGFKVNNTRIVQAGGHAQAIGHCEIDFAADGSVEAFRGKNELLIGRRLCLDATLTQSHDDDVHQQAKDKLSQHPNVLICKKDADVHALLCDRYQPQVRKLQQTVLAEARYPLRHVRIPDALGGSELVPLVAESFHYMMEQQGFEVEFAIHNAGGIRTSLNPGKITEADIAGKLLPFAVPIGVYQIKGKYIAEMLEGAINNATNNGVVGTGSGSYPYTYNLDFTYHAHLPAGERICDLSIYKQGEGWQKVEPEKLYNGTSSAYTMKGKEGYSAITKMEGDCTISGFSMADCFTEFLRANPDRLNSVAAKQRAGDNLA
ncbi:bifunctional metallophosphatase/5'-nucleotidase [Vibrio sp. SCSIO 43137]|uniref:bifunctional metallophosphatase/5'-nucleotidase n=1 Tax=Vibrio sp. SCSIO 43137 TaxID=3021011 RepID=UPI0023081B79|nr:bifunctional UDP-sugar hydrolase/5'-nucleotidase [Vibrio sp. SCSIO 43137]WCE31330.1 bifunctional UDP-sugar hydrolase/5'-nucleotidase [Vibrio sp. SCSIO 43137]